MLLDHLGHGLSGLDAPLPGLDRCFEMAELLWNRPGRLVAELMAGVAAVGLDDVQPLGLALQGFRHAVAVRSRARELAFLRDLEHRVPVDGRIIFRCGGGIRRHHRIEVQHLSGRGLDFGGVDQPVSAHPHAVVGFRKIGNEVAPRSSVTTILAILVGRSVVSAITQMPASGPFALVTTPPRSLSPMLTVSCWAPSCVGEALNTADSSRQQARIEVSCGHHVPLLSLARMSGSFPEITSLSQARRYTPAWLGLASQRSTRSVC